jgi:hypothetical protein
MKKKTAEDFLIESDNFIAHNNGRYYQIKTRKGGHHVDTKMSKDEAKEALVFYESQRQLVESAGDYLESKNFYATPDHTRLRHNIWRRGTDEHYSFTLFGEHPHQILRVCEKELLED